MQKMGRRTYIEVVKVEYTDSIRKYPIVNYICSSAKLDADHAGGGVDGIKFNSFSFYPKSISYHTYLE